MISVTILNKNGQRTLAKTLDALKSFKEVLLLDTGSEDQSLLIAKQYPNVRIEKASFNGFGPLHNLAAKSAKFDWILSIDSDEVLSPELCQEIFALSLDPKQVYSISLQNFYRKKWIQSCGWWPDRHVRLYNKKQTSFSADFVHEKIITRGLKELPLNAPAKHYSYHTISDFLEKMQRYSELFAEQNCGKKKSSPLKALFHGVGAFFKTYFLKRGFLDGYEGFVISSYNASTAFYKYLKLYEANQKK